GVRARSRRQGLRLRPAGARPLRRGSSARRDRGTGGLRVALSDLFFPKRMWKPRSELKRRYEVVVVGGGSHGLATAYYLAKRHGIRDVAILEKSYIGSGAAGGNTALNRSHNPPPPGAAVLGDSAPLFSRPSDGVASATPFP